MKSSTKSRNLQKAVEAFGELPADMAALGKPLSVHPPSTMARIGARLAVKIGAGPSNTVAMRRLADALVHVRDGEFTVIRWQDVETLDAPASARCWRVIARDGRQIDLPGWIEDDGTAIESTVERVTAVLLPQFLQRIEAGKKVMFGP